MVTWVIISCPIQCLHILCLFPACIISFYSEGQPLILSLMHSLRAFTPWWAIILAIILLQWQRVSIRCNYIVKLPRRLSCWHKGLEDHISPLNSRTCRDSRQAADGFPSHKMWAAGARFRPASYQSAVTRLTPVKQMFFLFPPHLIGGQIYFIINYYCLKNSLFLL